MLSVDPVRNADGPAGAVEIGDIGIGDVEAVGLLEEGFPEGGEEVVGKV